MEVIIMEINKEKWFGGLPYWKKKVPNDTMFFIKLFRKYNDILQRSENPIPYLLEIYEKFPDSADIMRWLALEYQSDREYLKALQIFMKLIELNPNVNLFKKEMAVCNAWIEAESMPQNEEMLQWLKKRLQEIWT